MRPTRLLVSLATGALVAVPGFALAQGAPFSRPPVQTPPAETPVTPELGERGAPDREAPELEEIEELELEEADEVEGPAAEDLEAVQEHDDEAGEGHGEAISTLAQCLPSGRELHGTGLTKGQIVSQAASGGEVVLEDEGAAMPVTTAEEATTLCGIVEGLVAETTPEEPAERATGRPDWAGPKGDDDGDAPGVRGNRGRGAPAG